jgi:hypothetical protein
MAEIVTLAAGRRAPAAAPTEACAAEGLVDLRALFPELWDQRAPGGALLDRGLRPLPADEAAAFLASQLGLWREYRAFCLRRLAKPAWALNPQDRARLRGQARRYRAYIDRAEGLLRVWGWQATP